MEEDDKGCPMIRGECFFWYRPTRVVPDQRPLNGCVCVTNFVVCMSSDVKVMLPQKNTINNLKVHVQNILTELLLRGNAIVLLHVNMQ